jgi:ectoine hydroxylase-related dioxygenase (phytanoyl-CoA dioxygenase family)
VSEFTIALDGFATYEGVLDAARTTDLIGVVQSRLIQKSGRGGVRNLLDIPEVRELVGSEIVRKLVAPVFGEGYFSVRGILFDKNHAANWKVPWHQDVTIAVKKRANSAGYGPWSVKSGVTHVQPPTEVLAGMLSVRLHLDDCPSENGALRVIPRSHLEGKLGEARIDKVISASDPVTCELAAGGALVMRPLLIHASSAATKPGHRRVLHFDFAAEEEPPGGLLQWAER